MSTTGLATSSLTTAAGTQGNPGCSLEKGAGAHNTQSHSPAQPSSGASPPSAPQHAQCPPTRRPPQGSPAASRTAPSSFRIPAGRCSVLSFPEPLRQNFPTFLPGLRTERQAEGPREAGTWHLSPGRAALEPRPHWDERPGALIGAACAVRGCQEGRRCANQVFGQVCIPELVSRSEPSPPMKSSPPH